MPPARRTTPWTAMLVIVVLLALVAGACTSVDPDGTGAEGAGTRVPSEDVSTAPGTSLDHGDDPDRFCAAVAALDQTDGTTDDAVALAAIDELRSSAPAEVRADVILSTDSLIVADYPDAADPSMAPASLEERTAAASRLRAYVEQRCDLAP